MDRGRRGRPRAGQPPPVDRAVRPVPLPRRRRCRSRSAARDCGAGSATASASTRDADGLATNAERVAHRERVIEVVEAAFADWDAEPLLARLAEVGVPAGKVRTLDEVYEWDQTAQPGPARRRRAPDARAGDAARARRCGSSTPTGAEVTRRDHAAPPTLDQHGRRDPRLAGRVVTRRPMTPARWSAEDLLDLVLDDGLVASRGTSRSTSRGHADGYQRELRRAAREGRHRRVGAHRPWPGPRPTGRRRGQRVRLPRRLDRARRRATGSSPPYAGPPPRACRCWPPPPPAAPGCRRAPRPSCEMVEISRARDGPPGRRAALPRAPAPPHDRRRLRLVGLARPRDGGRARGAGRLPRARRSTRRSTASRSRPGVQTAENLAAQGRHRRRRRRPRTCPSWSTAPWRCWSTRRPRRAARARPRPA